MRIWLYVTTIDNWKITQKTNIIGFSEKNVSLTTKITTGDKGIIYIKRYGGTEKIKDSLVVASFTIGTFFFDKNQELFVTPQKMSPQIFPYRYSIQNIQLFKNQIRIKNLVQNLAFFKNKTRWGAHLMGKVMVELPKDDFKLIINSANIK